MENSKKELQSVLLNMLHDFDAVCKKHDIKYMLFAGSALGAVRHSGFIPWDDDLDIIMLRSEYEKFFDIASQEFSDDRYYVQKEFSEHWPMFFSKLRLNGTAAMEKYHPKDVQMHQGVYIDIFPCDELSDNRIIRKIQFLASKAVIAKSLDKRGYVTCSPLKKMFIFMCRFLPQKPLWKFCVMKKLTKNKCVHTFFACGSEYKKNVFPRSWISEITERQFCDGEFPVSAHYDELLTKLYGDYMTPPVDAEKKCKEHIAILDLNKSYKCYINEQKNMSFEILTESIR